jgi:hypothetical protein
MRGRPQGGEAPVLLPPINRLLGLRMPGSFKPTF